MRVRSLSMIAPVLALAAAAYAADDPFTGTWKLNPERSQFTGSTITIDKTSEGMKFSAAGMEYAFQLDGKEVPALMGYTAAWKQVDDHRWETANRLNGKLNNTDYLTLSDDGQTLTVVTKGTRPDGTSYEETAVYGRESGSGLTGKWRTKKVVISQPEVMVLSITDDGTFTESVPALKASWTGKMDGTYQPVKGESIPPGFTLSVRRTGPRSIEVTSMMNGKEMFRATDVVSEDGKTRTVKGRPVAVDEPYTAVYERQ